MCGRSATGADVLALAFEVDYWDRLGWKDTFSSPAWTARQYAYARAMGRDGVYTPQVVVNGRAEGDGLDAGGLAALMQRGERGAGGPRVAFDGRTVTVGQGAAPAGAPTSGSPATIRASSRSRSGAARTPDAPCRTRTSCATWSSLATGPDGRRRFRFQPAAPASPRRRSSRRPAPARSWRRRDNSRCPRQAHPDPRHPPALTRTPSAGKHQGSASSAARSGSARRGTPVRGALEDIGSGPWGLAPSRFG